MRTVYVIMYVGEFGDLPHSVYLTRKEAMTALLKIDKRAKRFHFIERAKMQVTE